ncbi:hypothetical protein P4O66_022779 [Electrophorus voltai]|uniref:Uncharacterized protein n=1 Tax=Electrophorus voltai TaxID=2609070 RepID=A0AAD9DZ72_9TELE|nr:hypothetical protein P4O66_022779 [Electrophorus voltai]
MLRHGPDRPGTPFRVAVNSPRSRSAFEQRQGGIKITWAVVRGGGWRGVALRFVDRITQQRERERESNICLCPKHKQTLLQATVEPAALGVAKRCSAVRAVVAARSLCTKPHAHHPNLPGSVDTRLFCEDLK